MQESLERLRPEINSMYEYFRSVNRECDPGDITGIFCRTAVPLYGAGMAPTDETLAGIFAEVLELAGRGFIGIKGKSGAVDDALLRIIHHHTELLARHRGFMTLVFNALFNINAKGERSMLRWRDAVLSGPRAGDPAEFKRRGLVHAWMCGLARFREGALGAAGELGDELLDKILGAPGVRGRAVLESMKKDPWFDPACSGSGPVFLHADGHRGLGGNFTGIPEVCAGSGALYALDRDSVFRIYADRFGVETVPVAGSVPAKGAGCTPDVVQYVNGRFITGNAEFSLPEFCSGEVKSAAASGNTVAWTMKNSYKIYIAGLRGPDV